MTYRAIASTEYDPEAFLTAELADAWTNNLLGALQGESAAHADGAAIRAAAMRGIATGSNVTKTVIGAREVVLSKSNAGSGSLSASTVLAHASLTALRAGSVTVSAELKRVLGGAASSGNAMVKVYKNGTLDLTLTGTTTTYTAYTGNVTFAAGDALDFEIEIDGSTPSGGGSNTGSFRLLRCLAAIPAFWGI